MKHEDLGHAAKLSILSAPQWTFCDENGRPITTEFLDSEREAQVFVGGWNDCAIRTGRPDILIYRMAAPDGTGYLVRIPEEWAP
jgi:hypothetical protein